MPFELRDTEYEVEIDRANTKFYQRLLWALRIIFGFKTKIKTKVKMI